MPTLQVDQKGYTLLELIVVVVLIGIFLTLGIPRFREALFTNPLHSSIRKLVGVATELRGRAAREQIDYLLHFEFAENLIWWAPEKASPEENEIAQKNGLRLPDGVDLTDVWTQGGGKKIDGEALIRFTRRGYTNHGVIHLRASGGEEFSLEIRSFLDRVKIHETYVEFGEPLQ